MNKHIENLGKLFGHHYWEYVLKHKDSLVVYLDNDDTYIKTYADEESYSSPQDYLGNSEGLKDLLYAIGINYEDV